MKKGGQDMPTEAETERREFIKRAAVASQQGMLSTDRPDEFNWSNPENHDELATAAMNAAESLYREFTRRYGEQPFR